MNGGDAAEQTVRLAMEGAEFTLKIAGEGAEHILALLMAALKPAPKGQKQSGPKLRGRERLRTMLKSGAKLKFFEIQGKDLKEFAAAAKKYGLAYCVLRQKDNEGGMVEIMAKAEDAARISKILEKLEAHDLGGGSCEPTKTKAEVKAEQKVTEKEAKKKRDGAVREARNESRQSFQGKRAELQAQYLQDIGKEPNPPKVRRQPQSRIGQLLQELTTEVVRRIPIIGPMVRRREEATVAADAAPAVPEHDIPAPDVADDLSLPPAQEGQAQPEAPSAVQKEEPAPRPPTRTERTATTKENPPSAPLSQTRTKGGEIISNEQGGKPSVKADLAAEIASRREKKPPSAKSKQPKQQGKQQKPKQPKPKKKAREK